MASVKMTTIYVAGYPRSGTTWLTRLLGDVLNCPTGGATPRHDSVEIATEGLDRPGPYLVRKGHYRPVDTIGGPVAVGLHELAWRNITDEKVVLIIRDPRDVAVSRSFYFKRLIQDVLENMTTDDKWNKFMTGWLGLTCDISLETVKYEKLRTGPEFCMQEILFSLSIPFDHNRMIAACHRQSFEQRIKWTMENLTGAKQASHLKFLRSGTPGQWKDFFTYEQERFAWELFGDVMEVLGYER